MYEEISNLGGLPIPNAKVNTRLPEGLKFITTNKKNGQTVLTEGVQSVFVLRGHAVIRRKWRIKCEKRGMYRPLESVMIVNDLFGSKSYDKILGLMLAANYIGYALGSPFINLFKDFGGSYAPGLFLLSGVMAVTLCLMLFVIYKAYKVKTRVIAAEEV